MDLGTRGKDGQGVPLSAGQPTMRIGGLTVGGQSTSIGLQMAGGTSVAPSPTVPGDFRRISAASHLLRPVNPRLLSQIAAVPR